MQRLDIQPPARTAAARKWGPAAPAAQSAAFALLSNEDAKLKAFSEGVCKILDDTMRLVLGEGSVLFPEVLAWRARHLQREQADARETLLETYFPYSVDADQNRIIHALLRDSWKKDITEAGQPIAPIFERQDIGIRFRRPMAEKSVNLNNHTDDFDYYLFENQTFNAGGLDKAGRQAEDLADKIQSIGKAPYRVIGHLEDQITAEFVTRAEAHGLKQHTDTPIAIIGVIDSPRGRTKLKEANKSKYWAEGEIAFWNRVATHSGYVPRPYKVGDRFFLNEQGRIVIRRYLPHNRHEDEEVKEDAVFIASDVMPMLLNAHKRLDGSPRKDPVFPTQTMLYPLHNILRGDKRLLHFAHYIAQGDAQTAALIPETKWGDFKSHALDISRSWIEKPAIGVQGQRTTVYVPVRKIELLAREKLPYGHVLFTETNIIGLKKTTVKMDRHRWARANIRPGGYVVQEFIEQPRLQLKEGSEPYILSLFMSNGQQSSGLLRCGEARETPGIVGDIGDHYKVLHLLKYCADLAAQFNFTLPPEQKTYGYDASPSETAISRVWRDTLPPKGDRRR